MHDGVQPHDAMCLVGDGNGTTLLHRHTVLPTLQSVLPDALHAVPPLFSHLRNPRVGGDDRALTPLPLAYVRSGTRWQRLMGDSPAGWGWTCSRATTLSSASWTPGCTTTTLSTASAQVTCSVEGSVVGIQKVKTEVVSRRKVEHADEGLADHFFVCSTSEWVLNLTILLLCSFRY